MAKTIIIRTVDFSENRLAQVTLTEQVPCTGISLSQSSLSLNTLTTQTLTATVNPEDCTEEVVWTSSDETIATVDGGVITLIGLGTVTITATCGSHSASCAITVDNIEIATGWEWGFAFLNNTSNDFGTANVPNDYSKIYYGDEIPLDSTRYRLSRSSSFVGDFNVAPTMLPNGVGSVRFESANMTGSYSVLFYDSAQRSGSTVNALILQGYKQNAPSSGIVDSTFNVPEGADSFTIGLQYKTTYSASDNADTVASEKGTKFILMHDAVATETET